MSVREVQSRHSACLHTREEFSDRQRGQAIYTLSLNKSWGETGLLSNITWFSLAYLGGRVDLVAMFTVTLVAARQVDADLTASVRFGTFINVCRWKNTKSRGKLVSNTVFLKIYMSRNQRLPLSASKKMSLLSPSQVFLSTFRLYPEGHEQL